ncbi:hypothetical protein O6H91_02G080600 [Diphasiastrum complanatum]|uniref:Uncharacterized protein n=1 Tax=Diphasiastrum complanatum TaxID=34168 RepID=A0ACC2EHK7_DIPCM|nr:hypothetical protein O6H91_02G080600 [Diphasiastrum complanatum]
MRPMSSSIHKLSDSDMLSSNTSEETTLLAAAEAKPRLRWSPELHQRFVDAVTQLGGPDRATPKSVMKAMGIQGLTLYHLKSHLQKYRLGKQLDKNQNQDSDKDGSSSGLTAIASGSQIVTSQNSSKNLQITEALHMQMEVQRKLHEQLEVQRHLQLRIEAQGKYLQTILEKATATLARTKPGTEGEVHQISSQIPSGIPFSSLIASGCGHEQHTPRQQFEAAHRFSENTTSMGNLEGRSNESGHSLNRKRFRTSCADTEEQEYRDDDGNGDESIQENSMIPGDPENFSKVHWLVEEAMPHLHSGNAMIRVLQAVKQIDTVVPLFRTGNESENARTNSDPLEMPAAKKRILAADADESMSPFAIAGPLQEGSQVNEMRNLYTNSHGSDDHALVFGNAAGLDLNIKSEAPVIAHKEKSWL